MKKLITTLLPWAVIFVYANWWIFGTIFHLQEACK